MNEFSAIYTGWIRHRRYVPVSNDFRYPIFMLYLDLDEIEQAFSKKWYCSINRLNVLNFKRSDYYAPEQSDLKAAIIDRVSSYYSEHAVKPPEIKKVRMLCHARYFNMVFNPVVFYYCFDQDNNVCAILSEITNTPWGERHGYVHPISASEQFPDHNVKVDRFENNMSNHKFQFKFKKQFHVSPFNPMNMDYRWVFSEAKKSIHIHMDNHIQAEGAEKHFDATLVMDRSSFSNNLGKTLIQQPFIIVKVVFGIYWQALKLWIKRSPFYDHPDTDGDVNKT